MRIFESLLNSNFGNIHFTIKENVPFVFSNSKAANVTVQGAFGNNVDMIKFITFIAVAKGGVFSYGLDSTSNMVYAMSSSELTNTYNVNILGVFYK